MQLNEPIYKVTVTHPEVSVPFTIELNADGTKQADQKARRFLMRQYGMSEKQADDHKMVFERMSCPYCKCQP